MRAFLLANGCLFALLTSGVPTIRADEAKCAATAAANVEFGEAVNGLSLGLAPQSIAVPMGARLRCGLRLRFDADSARAKTRLLNCGDSARSMRFFFKHLDSGKTYERRPFDVGLPPGLRPADIVRLDEAPIPAEDVVVHLLSQQGQQIPPGKYALTANYANNANPRVEVFVAPDGSVRQQPYEGPLGFWTGKLASAPVALTILPAEAKTVDIKANSHLIVRRTPDGIGWKWGRQMPIELRVKRRPGYTVGARYDLHVFLDGKEVESGGGGLGGPWHGGDGESFLSPKIQQRVAAGARLTLRADVTIFETSVPVQHLWAPESGAFKVLWKGPVAGSLKE